MSKPIVIAKNVPLTTRLTALEILITNTAEITIITSQFGPDQNIPQLSTGYLEHLCTEDYFGGIARQHSIADILMLNGLLTRSQYDDFYYILDRTLSRGEFTIISSELFR